MQPVSPVEAAGLSSAAVAATTRKGYVDVFRGLLIAHMALDHASLMAVDAVAFVVLSAIGASLIVLALVRNVPSRVLLPAALAVLALHPLLDVSGLPIVLQAILHEPVRDGAFRSLYPVIPWAAIVVLGFVVGRDAITRERPAGFWWGLAAISALLFVAVRLNGGYGNAYPYTSVTDLDFWFFAKYPTDLPFLTFSFAVIFSVLAVLWNVARTHVPALLRPFEVFGRVPFFFYVVHFYVLGVAAAIVRQKFGLAETYLIWAGLLVLMVWPCKWYYEKKTQRPNWVTRYF